MIGFNGTYLHAASLGNMRITAAALGGQWVMGGKWLMIATAQAIIAAFGAEEGIAVISKTNDYLNAIALTDPQRAQQLDMFINEDPMLVCSLVETSKERWLVGDGNAYIITDLIPLKSDVIDIRVMCTTNISQGATIFGRYPNLYLQNWRNTISCNGSENGATSAGNIYDIELNSTYYIVNGNQKNYSRRSCNDVCGLFGFYYNGWSQFWIGAINYVHMNESNLLPFIRNGENGMLDIISGTFYPNANTKGAFTIAITDKA